MTLKEKIQIKKKYQEKVEKRILRKIWIFLLIYDKLKSGDNFDGLVGKKRKLKK